MNPAHHTNNREKPMPATDRTPTDQHTGTPTAGHQMDSRMMWVMMIGCCLAVPFALIIGGASFAGLAGASPWLIGLGVILAIALLVGRRRSADAHCDMPTDRDG